MSYFIPVNKIAIECTQDMWINFSEVPYESYCPPKFYKPVDLVGRSWNGYDPYCFVVKFFGYIKSFTSYEEAEEFYNERVKAIKEKHEILHSS